jgi:hexosaminidase
MTENSSSDVNVIPHPANVRHREGVFNFGPLTPIIVLRGTDEATAAARYLQEKLQLKMSSDAVAVKIPAIVFGHADSDRGAEGYELDITEKNITILASARAGWFYGVQTLLQLLPVNSTTSTIACVKIVDRPRFKWRGLMLDVVRHMMPVDGILRLLDNMAAHKLNTFHWHLTDDHGWRIPSNRFPLLTEIGAWRIGIPGPLPLPGHNSTSEKVRYGGYYTHEDIREIVNYANERNIRVVPEIEMPGHAMAALSAYPELSCTGGPFTLPDHLGIFKDVYCAGNEATFDFLEQVIEEIIPYFPGEYFHVGGDECPKDRWRACPKCQRRIREEGLKNENELQSYFMQRIQAFLSKHGKRMIGWDEIIEGGSMPNTSVMGWRSRETGIAAAVAGHDVVLTPHTHCYLDYRQALDGEPSAIGDIVTSLEKTYAYEPVPPELTPAQAKQILGLQGNIWTEFMPDMPHVEYMTWPRAAAIAEIGWATAEMRNLDNFRRRVKNNESRLTIGGSAFRPIQAPNAK